MDLIQPSVIISRKQVAEAKHAKDIKHSVSVRSGKPIESSVLISKRDIKQANAAAKAHAKSCKPTNDLEAQKVDVKIDHRTGDLVGKFMAFFSVAKGAK